MERLFPRALIACIREARPPTPQELASMAEKIWREAFPERPFRHARAMTIAAVALTGERQTCKGPPASCPAEPFPARMRCGAACKIDPLSGVIGV
jgi:hypothetical protein